uniref:Uncharacterized protein n=1 Tax=Arundo donax TaxID=35708 RepID=A0A0A9BAV8_ARUDO
MKEQCLLLRGKMVRLYNPFTQIPHS